MSGENDFWTATIAVYEPLQIPSPKLSEKTLKRPPFRFIHDLVGGIDLRFQAYNHLFTAEELDQKYFDTKEKKFEYLNKLVAFLASLLGRPIDVNTKKIVSGSEPERTNEFLRDLALGIGYAQQAKVTGVPVPPAQPSSAPPSSGVASRPFMAPPLKLSPDEQREKDTIIYETSLINEQAAQYMDTVPSGTTVLEINRSIIAMAEELKQKGDLNIQPANMPAESMEMAIKRQLDVIKQLKRLMDRNESIIHRIENAAVHIDL